MKTNFFVLIIVAMATYALTFYLTDNPAKPPVNNVPDKTAIAQKLVHAETMPPFTFTDINGNQKTSSDFHGKIIMLNFWASWCAPCIKEFPNLLKAAETHSDDVVLIALSSDLEETAIPKFIQKVKPMDSFQGLNFNAPNIFIAHDADQTITAKTFATFKLPETLIIDQNGFIRHKLIGADWTQEDLQNIIESIKE